MSVSLSINTDRLDKRINLIKGGMKQAIARASRRAATHGKKLISDEVRQRVAIKAGTVKKQVKSYKGENTGQVLKLKKSGRVSLREFGARQTARGVSYRIGKSGKRGFIASAFQGPKPGMMFTKYEGTVFKRIGAKKKMTKGSYIGKLRQPITKIWGPSTWGAFTGGKTKPDATKPVKSDLEEFYQKRLEHEVAYLISKSEQV